MIKENDYKLLGISLSTASKQDILEKIKLYINQPGDMLHIVSLNPENMVMAMEDEEFRNAIQSAHVRINDGVGVVWGARIHGMDRVPRLTGVELMKELLEMGKRMSLRTMLIGGKPNLAIKLAQCYNESQDRICFTGLEGIKKIAKPDPVEEKNIFNIVAAAAPQIVLVAFGSPWQEKWLWRNRDRFKGVVCMGVGQGFDVLAGEVRYAPVWIRRIGLEWFFRLVTQPWRWKRQLRLFKYAWLVLRERIA